MTVGVERRPARRAMTVQDLMRHTSGLTYAQFGDSPVQKIWQDAQLMDDSQTNADLAGKLARLPLMFEPGTTWEYSMSTDVLGRVVEIASGQDLETHLRDRICAPLGMIDTGFDAEGEGDRVAHPQADAATDKRPPMRDPAKPVAWASGGGGLVSTAHDYLRFCQMLLNGGALDGTRLLAPKSIAHMASDHLPPGCEYGSTTRSPLRRARTRPGDGLRLWPRLLRAQGAGDVAGAGLGRRILLGRRPRHLFLDRPAGEPGRRPDDASPRPASSLPCPVAPPGLRRDHGSGAARLPIRARGNEFLRIV